MAARRTKRADGRFVYTFSFEGKRYYGYGKTQAEAKADAAGKKRSLEADAPVRDSSRTLSDWLTEWRTTMLRASDRSMSTQRLYAGLTARHVDPVIGGLPLRRIRPADVTQVLLTMEKQGLAPSTRRNAYAAMRWALADAVDNGLLAANPVLKVKRPKTSSSESLSLDSDQTHALVEAADRLRYGSAVRLILMTGLRRGEALALRWSDIDLNRREARVTGSLVRQDGALVVSSPKTAGSRRTVSLSGQAVALLKAHRLTQAGERLRAGSQWSETGFVFVSDFGPGVRIDHTAKRPGNPVDPRNLLRTVTIAATKAGITGAGVHTLRHTYATTALLHGVPIHVVSRNLGHSSIAITADIYGHLTDEASQAAADRVSLAFGF
jgi:integrase